MVNFGRTLIVGGAAIMLLGAIIVYAPGAITWFGRLPGDIHIEGERFSFYFPLTSLVLVNVVLFILARFLFR